MACTEIYSSASQWLVDDSTPLALDAGDLSRNRTVGLRIGRGEKLSDIMKSTKAVAEGVLTSRSAHNLADRMGVECPIITGIFKVIHGKWVTASTRRGTIHLLTKNQIKSI